MKFKFKNKFLRLCIGFGFFLFFSCSVFSKDYSPYSIKANMSIEENEEYELAGINLRFGNKTEKDIQSFTLVFYMYDQDGEPVSLANSSIVLDIKHSIKAFQNFDCCISLDSYFLEAPEYAYEIDYMYVSKIVYADESVWTDPLGLVMR